AARALQRALPRLLPQGSHRVLPASRRRQGGLGQHRHLRLARAADADQDRFSVSRFHPRRADRPRPDPLPRSGAARGAFRHPGVALLLLQIADVAAGLKARARSLHPAPEVDQHAADPGWRGGPRPLGAGLLRGGGRAGERGRRGGTVKYTPQERPLVRRAWLWSAAGASLIRLALAAVASRGSGAVPVETARAARRDLVVPLLSDGVLETAPGGELRASEGGTVAQIAAREGEKVRRGALLLRIDSPELEVKAQQARSEALQLASERTRAGAELESERREAARLQRIAESDERLVKEGAITRAAREADENAYRQAAERVRSAQA